MFPWRNAYYVVHSYVKKFIATNYYLATRFMCRNKLSGTISKQPKKQETTNVSSLI